MQRDISQSEGLSWIAGSLLSHDLKRQIEQARKYPEGHELVRSFLNDAAAALADEQAICSLCLQRIAEIDSALNGAD